MELTQPLETNGLPADDPQGEVAIVVLTHNRLHLLKKNVENVLSRTSDATREIVIWDNASTDGTAEYLAAITDPRIRVVRSEENVGQNGYARSFRETTAPYLIEIDDDVTDAPQDWDKMMRDAYAALPDVGFLAADLVNDPNDQASQYRHVINAHLYELGTEQGVNLYRGPAGGGCAITARALNELAGGFREREGEVFWLEDAAYIADIQQLGFTPAVMADLQVHHTGGAYYTQPLKEKEEYWRKHWARVRRRTAAKRVLVKVPGVRRLNDRFGWFVAPS